MADIRFCAAMLAMVCSGLIASGRPMDYVDPFIGTSGTGHTHPAACVPFGLVQAGPDTGNYGWDHCSGYRYEESVIIGFSQTRLSGTGARDLGDAMIMPVAGGPMGEGFTWSRFRKETEKAGPGWYRVTLDNASVDVEVTATEHVGCYTILPHTPGRLRLLVDAQYGIVQNAERLPVHVLTSDVRRIGDDAIGGTQRVRQWVERVYSFKTVFSKIPLSVEKLPKRDAREVAPRYLALFDVREGEALRVKVALSADGGLAGAERNLEAEVPDWDFAAVRFRAEVKWSDLLDRIEIEGTDAQKRNFYSSAYRMFLQPNNLADAGEKPFYSTFSTWDTYRAAHPLYTIVTPERVPEMVESLLEQGRRTGYLPVWSLWGQENQCMIGTHSVPVIVDWFLKECKGENAKCRKQYWLDAYVQIKDTLTKPHPGRRKERWDLLDKYGYYPFDEIRGESVSRTMECAYDDWCAGVMAEKLGFAADAEFFMKRSQNWRNVFDPSLGLVRGKDSHGKWRTPYNPLELGHGAADDNDFTEGNAWQYTWHVMQDPVGLVEAIGGLGQTTELLDRLFSQESVLIGGGGRHDISGMIGQYVHGNEPSHHIPYLYQYLGRPDRTAETVREICDRLYAMKPDGLCGNDDCGQMSAWYVFSSIGFYPFNPCGGEYVIGAPQVACAKLKVENGEFCVVARNLSRENKYVKSVSLNGKPLTGWKIRHADIIRGGELVFEMTNKGERK